jgi:hypothetical protein
VKPPRDPRGPSTVEIRGWRLEVRGFEGRGSRVEVRG